jgi:hypothetical protein
MGGEGELVALVDRLSDSSRLITLTGAGGIGKSRLALEVAGRLLERMSDGVFLIELAGIERPEDVVGAIAATVGAGVTAIARVSCTPVLEAERGVRARAGGRSPRDGLAWKPCGLAGVCVRVIDEARGPVASPPAAFSAALGGIFEAGVSCREGYLDLPGFDGESLVVE